MSHLLDKSKFNEEAALLLKEREYFAPAIHCRYYSCIQKFIYILKEYFTEEYEAGLKSLKGGHGNRHSFYIKELTGRLPTITQKPIPCKRDITTLRTKMRDLRNLRIESDYNETEITKDLITTAESHFTEIQKLIKRHTQI